MKDAVCGMEVSQEKFASTYKGKKYLFCSSACKTSFEKQPERFAK